jgi:hypothetical protein
MIDDSKIQIIVQDNKYLDHIENESNNKDNNNYNNNENNNKIPKNSMISNTLDIKKNPPASLCHSAILVLYYY